MPRILIVQSRTDATLINTEQAEYRRTIGEEAALSFVSSLDETLAWETPAALLAGFDGVIFGGSSDFDFDGGREPNDAARLASQRILARVQPLIEWVLATEFPLFGICYGHQLVGEACGVAVVCDPAQKKRGTFAIALTDAGTHDVLFGTLPATFLGQYGHKDSLSAVPERAVLLAQSDMCRVSALRYGSRAYTVQFHPELTDADMAKRCDGTAAYLPEGCFGEATVRPSPEASTLLRTFIAQVVRLGASVPQAASV